MLDEASIISFAIDRQGEIQGTVGDSRLTKEVGVYLRTWFAHHAGKPQRLREKAPLIQPGEERYLDALTRELTSDPYLRFWAYATYPVMVSTAQVAYAMGKGEATASFREMLVDKYELSFTDEAQGHHRVPMSDLADAMPEVADRVLLFVSQVGAFLGLSPRVARRHMEQLEIAIPDRPGAMAAPWRSVKCLRRTGPRTVVKEPLSPQ
jgi:hypothetical protein